MDNVFSITIANEGPTAKMHEWVDQIAATKRSRYAVMEGCDGEAVVIYSEGGHAGLFAQMLLTMCEEDGRNNW